MNELHHSRHTHLPEVVRLLVTRLSSIPTHQSGCEQSLADNGRSKSDVAALAADNVRLVQICFISASLTCVWAEDCFKINALNHCSQTRTRLGLINDFNHTIARTSLLALAGNVFTALHKRADTSVISAVTVTLSRDMLATPGSRNRQA